MKNQFLMKNILILIVAGLFLNSCQTKPGKSSIDTSAEKYVRLVLAIGQYDGSFVDAYFGPDEWKPAGEKLEVFPVDEFTGRISNLVREFDNLADMELSASEEHRLNWLNKLLVAVETKVEMIAGKVYDFDTEAKLLYDAKPPKFSKAYFDSLLNNLDSLLPGNGTISERYLSYSKQFIIPPEKLDTIFKVAITEARKRTNKYIQLPKNENFTLEYVTDKSWGAYNYYLGNGQSKIQINTDNPISIERVIDLACHEGYPGHHVFMTLVDQNLYKEKGWVEYSIYPLFSPLSLIAEGSANYGIEVVFPGAERIRYEQEVLFPMAGIDPASADKYYTIQDLRSQLNYSGNEAARKYLNGEISREDAATWIEKYNLCDHKRALQKIRFYDDYRSYIINYNLGKDLVSRHISSLGGTADQPEKRWLIFKDLLSNPPTPGSLDASN